MRAVLSLVLTAAALAAVPAIAEEAEDHELMTCGYLCADDGPLSTSGIEGPPDTELVRKIFLGAFSETCSWAIGGGRDMWEPEVHDFTYRPIYLNDEQDDLQVRVYQFFCGAGAYNQRHVFLSWTSDDGVRPISFARPTYAIDYVTDDLDGAFTGISIVGMDAKMELVNAYLDPEGRTISEWSCWRGLCDASSRGTWVLDQERGGFRLVTYDIDPSYDGEVNLIRLVDFSQPSAVDISEPMPFDPEYFDKAWDVDDEADGDSP